MKPHRLLLGSGGSVKLHKGNRPLFKGFRHEVFGQRERIGQMGSGKIGVAQDVDDADFGFTDVQIANSPTGVLLGEVCRSKDRRVLVDELDHVKLIVDLLASGQHVDAALQQLHRMGFAETESSGGSFPVCDHQINRLFFPERSEVLANGLNSRLSDDFS